MTPFDDDDEFEPPIEGEFHHVDNADADADDDELAHAMRELTQEEIDDQVHQQARDVQSSYSRVILPQNATKASAVSVLSRQIPLNEFQLPAFFYRSDLLPHDLSQLTQEEADVCLVELSYADGYPTYNNGHTFWQQLPHESFNDFILFQRYCDQADTIGLRQIHLLAHENNVSMAKIQELYEEYYWKFRARAFDLFQVAADRKLRERRSRRLEDNHYQIADTLLSELKHKLENPEIFNNLSGKELLECLRLLINIQRVSSGLAQNGNAGATPYNPEAAMDGRQLMEELTKNNSSQDVGLGLGGGLADLLKDPNFALEAQKIVLRVRHQNDPNAHSEVRPIAEQ